MKRSPAIGCRRPRTRLRCDARSVREVERCAFLFAGPTRCLERDLTDLESGVCRSRGAGLRPELCCAATPRARQVCDRVCETVRIAEQRAAGDQHVGPAVTAPATGLGADAAVDLDVDLGRRSRRPSPATSAIFGSIVAMYSCPPKPGFTVITSTSVDQVEHVRHRRRRGRRVQRHAGARPGSRIAAERAVQVHARLGVHDQPLAAGLDVAAGHQVGGRRPSGGLRTARSLSRHAAMTSGPNVMLGTNWPSITSHWMRSTPAFSRACDHALAETGQVGREHRRDDRDWLHDETLRPTARPYARTDAPTPPDLDGRRRRRPRTRRRRPRGVRRRRPSRRARRRRGVRGAHRLRQGERRVGRGASGRPGFPALSLRGRRLRRLRLAAHRSGGAGRAQARDRRRRPSAHRPPRRSRRLGRPGARAEGLPNDCAVGVQGGRAAFRTHRSHDLVDIDECLVAHPLLADLIRDGRFGERGRLSCVVASARASGSCSRLPVRGASTFPTTWCSSGRTRSSAVAPARSTRVVHGRRFTISATSFFQARTDGAARDGRRGARGLRRWRRAGHVRRRATAGSVSSPGCSAATARWWGSNATAPPCATPATTSATCAGRAGRGRHVEPLARPGGRRRPGPTRVGREVRGSARRNRCYPVGPRELRSRVPRSRRRAADGLAGFAHQGSTLIDLFPHTPHVEVVTRFDRLE